METSTFAAAPPHDGQYVLHDVVIVGGGLGGIAVARRLADSGLSYVLVDARDGLGGVWRANRYPGAACDVPSALYSYTFADNYEWTRGYATQPEILDYISKVATTKEVLTKSVFGTRIVDARYDQGQGEWTLESEDGRHFVAKALVLACGQLSTPSIPKLPQLELFEGMVTHTADWPSSLQTAGLRIGVVGTGASAIQVVTGVAEGSAHVTVFQRSAPYLLPKWNPVYSRRVRRFLARSGVSRWILRRSLAGAFDLGALGLAGSLPPFQWLLRFVSTLQRNVQLRNRELRRQATPNYPFGCKRVLFSTDYYRALSSDLVTLETSEITGFTSGAVLTAGSGEVPLDLLVFASGFEAQNFVGGIEVVGREGTRLSDVWADGPAAHLGVAIPRFPNMFLVYGPNTNLGSGSVVAMLESQAGYIATAVQTLLREAHPLEVRQDVFEAADRRLQKRLRRSVWNQCTSWYRSRETGRITNNWPGSVAEYQLRTRRFEVSNFVSQEVADAE